jgi:hypothetical protein
MVCSWNTPSLKWQFYFGSLWQRRDCCNQRKISVAEYTLKQLISLCVAGLAMTLTNCDSVRQTYGNCSFWSNGKFVSLDVKSILGMEVSLLLSWRNVCRYFPQYDSDVFCCFESDIYLYETCKGDTETPASLMCSNCRPQKVRMIMLWNLKWTGVCFHFLKTILQK